MFVTFSNCSSVVASPTRCTQALFLTSGTLTAGFLPSRGVTKFIIWLNRSNRISGESFFFPVERFRVSAPASVADDDGTGAAGAKVALRLSTPGLISSSTAVLSEKRSSMTTLPFFLWTATRMLQLYAVKRTFSSTCLLARDEVHVDHRLVAG